MSTTKTIPARLRKGSWLISDDGVFFSSENQDTVQIATEPVSVLAVLIEDGFYSLEVSFPSLKGKSIIAPRANFLDSRKIRKSGLPIVSSLEVRNAASLMSSFINDIEEDAPNIKSREEIIFHKLHNQSSESSSEEGIWFDVGNVLRTEFPYSRAIMAASFASPLVSLLGHRNIFYHISGSPSSGKTSLLRFAMSIWGDPGKNVISFYATDAGLRDYAEEMNFLPLAIDQVELVNPKSKLPSLVYELCEHFFRTPRYIKEWHNCIISTGNKSICSLAPNLRKYPSLLDVKADPLTREASRKLGNLICRVASAHYGFAGTKFVSFLVEKKGSIKADYEKMLKELVADVHYECVENVAVLCLADFYSGISVFREKDERKAWREAIELGREIMTASKR